MLWSSTDVTDAEALTVALHRTRHRISEPGYTPEPCGACRQEAASLIGSLPTDWGLVDLVAWRKELGSKTKAGTAYQAGLADGAERERQRVREALGLVLAG